VRIGIVTLAAAIVMAVAGTATAFNTLWAFSSSAPYYTDEDWASEDENIRQALNDNPDGTVSEWLGAESGISGTAKPLRSYKNKQGQSCRLLELTSKRMEQVDRAAGHFCRDDSGEWVFVGMAKLKNPSESTQ